jgi:hypothetical protein
LRRDPSRTLSAGAALLAATEDVLVVKLRRDLIGLFEAGYRIDAPGPVLEDGKQGRGGHEHVQDDGGCAGEPIRYDLLSRQKNPELFQEPSPLVPKPALFYKFAPRAAGSRIATEKYVSRVENCLEAWWARWSGEKETDAGATLTSTFRWASGS